MKRILRLENRLVFSADPVTANKLITTTTTTVAASYSNDAGIWTYSIFLSLSAKLSLTYVTSIQFQILAHNLETI